MVLYGYPCEEFSVYSMNDSKFNRSLHANKNLVNEPSTRINHEHAETSNHDTDLHNFSNSGQSSSLTIEGDSSGSADSFNATLKFVSNMLMEEEDLELKSLILQDPLALQAVEKSLHDVLVQNNPPSSNKGENSYLESRFHTRLVQDSIFDHIESVARFRGKTGEASSISQMGKSQIIDLENFEYNLPKRKRNQQREYVDSQGESRRSKQPAVYTDDSESIEMFDRVLLYHGDSTESAKRSGKTVRSMKKEDNKQMVDLWTLLTQCAQAVASYDQRSATEQLRQIRQHSSPHGDSTQRLAHYFANALEARLTGRKTASYTSLVSSEMSLADILKAHQAYITASPFSRMSFSFANQTIKKLAENAKSVHIIDFGILYGFQWPELIQRLSQTPGGPPKLRITGIELPQPGFQPSEKVEETKRRLANYCERFNVPSEHNIIAQKWETISYEDLNINRERDEVVVVNCLYRLRHIPDETVVMNNPRDTVLKLIRRISPDVFIHGVVNGTYNAPFFGTRFKEALFQYFALFDMFDTTVPRQDEYRLKFEKAIYGRDIENVIACEGSERVERPETYRQWQVRNTRAGFKQIPLDNEIFEAVKNTVHSSYDKDFVVERHGQWLLQGWKGRRIYAISCWKPT